MLYPLELAPFSFSISDWHSWAFFECHKECGPKEKTKIYYIKCVQGCSIFLIFSSACLSPSLSLSLSSEMSVRMSNLDNERDDRDEDSHEDRGISKIPAYLSGTASHKLTQKTLNAHFSISNYTEGFYVHQNLQYYTLYH